MYLKRIGTGKDKPEKLRKALFSSSDKRRGFSSGNYIYERYCEEGLPVERISKGSHPSSAILVLHGGGFYSQITDRYRRLMKFYLGKTNAVAVMPDYGVSVREKYPMQLNEAYACYLSLVKDFSENIVIVGDGVGANLALSLCLKAKKENVTLPKGLVCIQPFLDMTLSGDSVYDHFYFDKFIGNYTVTLPDLKEALKDDRFFSYLHGASKVDPLVSPLFGEFEGFPKTYIITGDYSIFESDALRVAKKMTDAGVEVTLDDYPEKYGPYPLDNRGKDKKKIPAFITSVLGVDKGVRRERQKKIRVKNKKVALNEIPIEPQDESAFE